MKKTLIIFLIAIMILVATVNVTSATVLKNQKVENNDKGLNSEDGLKNRGSIKVKVISIPIPLYPDSGGPRPFRPVILKSGSILRVGITGINGCHTFSSLPQDRVYTLYAWCWLFPFTGDYREVELTSDSAFVEMHI